MGGGVGRNHSFQEATGRGLSDELTSCIVRARAGNRSEPSVLSRPSHRRALT